LEEVMPPFITVVETQDILEKHYNDMQDMEFTIQEGKFWMLQTRNGKRTAAAMVSTIELLAEGRIDEKQALMQEPSKLEELLHPVFDISAIQNATVLTKGMAASPSAATGQMCSLRMKQINTVQFLFE
jgi:pyruvate,orthophosphate dikinase